MDPKPLSGGVPTQSVPLLPLLGEVPAQSVLLLPLSGEVPASVRPLAAPLRGSTRAVHPLAAPLRGSTRAVRLLAAPFRGSTRVSPSTCCPFQGKYPRERGKGFQNPSVTASAVTAPLRGEPRGAREWPLRFSAHPPTPLRWRGVVLEISRGGGGACERPRRLPRTSFRPDRSFYLFYQGRHEP